MNKLIVAIISLNFLFAIITLPDFESFNWKNIQRKDVIVDYFEEDGIQWCRSYLEADYSILEISRILEDKSNYPNVFDRITETILYTDDIVHIKLDLPFPWAGRDYIIKYTENLSENSKEYNFIHYDDLDVPVEDGYVRLHRAAGRWKLIELSNGKTQIEYIWNGELLGDFPSWALKLAWKEQGSEVLTWLIDYMDDINEK